MARIFTTPAGEAAAKAWMHDVMVIGGVLSSSQRTSSDIYFTYYNKVPSAEAGKICDELINRDFSDIDSDIKKLSNFKFYASMTDAKVKQFDPEGIAKAIVYMAECLGLYWDDTIRTPYEITTFQKTLLGNAVYKYGRYISNIKGTQAKSTKSASSGSSTKTSASGSAQAPSSFKQSGPQSSKARGIIDLSTGNVVAAGQPGEKVFMETDCALAIRGLKTGVKSQVFAQIRPLDPAGAAGNTNAVFISASHGYGCCTCYFERMPEATDFYANLVASGKVPSDVTKLEIVKTSKVDKNGYFLADTEFGVCAISAKVLNEDINEQNNIEEDFGKDWEKATERYTKEELDELHSWMRKD